ncbi:MAG: hypothetical protein NC828_01245 [Candidatus Omnitrophica bacterium]|nr:hypothetical protein [Candidatus Omnitrophota bacterium]
MVIGICIFIGVLTTQWSFFSGEFINRYVGIFPSITVKMGGGNVIFTKIVQALFSSVGCGVILGLVLSSDKRLKQGGISLIGIFVAVSLQPYLFERYYIYAITSWVLVFLYSWTNPFGKQPLSFTTWQRRTVIVWALLMCIAGIVYESVKMFPFTSTISLTP